MFYRKIIADLEKWSASKYRKSLVLRGARQVGKTTAVRMFAEQFDTFIELNLEEEKDRNLFSTGTDVQNLLNLIMISKNVRNSAGRVLLFIDEIQYSSNAMLSLRYFYEKMPEIYVIAAGSLLEVYLTKAGLEVSVGRIEYLWVYPVDFDEFLLAEKQQALVEQMNQVPYPEYAYQPLKEQFAKYCLIGGMPEAVKVWVETKDITQVCKVYESIIAAYYDDIAKYANSSEQVNIIRQIMEAAFFKIGKRITFDGFGDTAYGSRKVKDTFNLLTLVSLFHLFYPVTSYNIPLLPNHRKKPKLLSFDIGITNYMVGIQDKYYTEDNLNSIFKGAAMEQVVGQQLISMQQRYGYKLYYWVRDSRGASAEIDYLLVWNNQLIPIEVKAGKTGTMKSLFLFMEESDTTLAVRVYDGENNVETVQTKNGKQFTILHLHLGLLTKMFAYLHHYFG